MHRILTLLFLILGSATHLAAQPPSEELRVFDAESLRGRSVEGYLQGLFNDAALRREVEQMKARQGVSGDWTAYRDRRRSFFLERLGGFPDRTPLNAKTVERMTFDDYTMEKVIFESRPDFPVTAALYLPNSPPPYPAVLVPCGHAPNGKAYESYQRVSILLAKNGIAALCFDPIGQGERVQILDEAGKPRFGSTVEHTLLGVGCILLGQNTAMYEIWDGMRGIDYLESRREIDPKRIGCTGNSGGGTQTSYLMALDPRVYCAAPNCYITSFSRLLPTIGPQDAEQNIHGQLAFGLDHADYIIMRAPRPTLISAATRDFFDIRGTWDSFREAKQFYGTLGFSERVEIAEFDTEHSYSKGHREATVRWMRRWLLGKDDPITEPEFPVLSDEQMQCTPEGQVLKLPGSKSAFELNSEFADRLAKGREGHRKKTSRKENLDEIREIAGIRPLEDLPSVVVESAGAIQREGYRIEKLRLVTDGKVPLAALAFIPDHPGADVALYLNGEGSAAAAGPGGPIEAIVKQGRAVLAVDLRGLGETYPTGSNAFKPSFGSDWQNLFLAYLLGKSYVGMRAEDVAVCARLARTFSPEGVKLPPAPRKVHLIATGAAAIPALHAAALEPDLFASARFERTIRSWDEIVRTPVTRDQLAGAIHGALRAYDLPDLRAMLPEEWRTMVDPVDGAGDPVKD